MKIPKSIDKYMPRSIIYGGLLVAGATEGLEELIRAASVVAILEVGCQVYSYGQRKGYFPHIKYEYKDNEK